MNAPRRGYLSSAAAGVAVAATLLVAATLFAPAASAKGPPPKITSFTVSQSCSFSATVSWKNVTVTEVIFTLNKGMGSDGQDFVQSLGTLSSPQTGFVAGAATTVGPSSFTFTAQLMDGSTQVGSVTTSKPIVAFC